MLQWCTVLGAVSAVSLVPNGFSAVYWVLFGPWLYVVPMGGWDYISMAAGIVAGIGTALIPPLLWIALARRKHVAVFFRRFRLSPVSKAMAHAVEHGIGRQIRVVTLDDHTFSSLEAPPGVRRFTRWAASAPLAGFILLGLAAIAIGVYMFLRYSISLTGLGVIGLMMVPMTLVFLGPVLIAVALYAVVQTAVFLLLRKRVRRRAKLTVTRAEDLVGLAERARNLGACWKGARFSSRRQPW
jgi:hypothetical protein